MATWQRLVGNAVTFALSGEWHEASTSMKEGARKAIGRLRPGAGREEAERRIERERRQTAERLAKLELFQQLTADPGSLLAALEAGSDLAAAVMDLQLRYLTPAGRRALATEIDATRRRLSNQE